YDEDTAYKYILRRNDTSLSVVRIENTHRHLACGNTTCTHNTEAHSEILSYEPLTDDYINYKGLPTSGNYYMIQNVNLTKAITINDTLNVCLNGYNITTSRAFESKDNKLVFTNCSDISNKIESTDTTLFKTTNIEVYGKRNNLPIDLKASEIYNDNGNSYNSKLVLSNVRIVERNVNSGILFRVATSNEVVVDNINISEVAFDTIFDIKGTVSMYGQNTITNNTVNRNMFVLSNARVNIMAGSITSISGNNITANNKNSSIIYMSDNTVNEIYEYGELNMQDNVFKKAEGVNPDILAMIYLSDKSKIRTGNTTIRAKVNFADDSLNDYVSKLHGIYSNSSENIFIADSGVFNTDESRIDIYINSTDKTGVIFKNWKEETVRELRTHKEVFTLQRTYTDDEKTTYVVALNEDTVNIVKAEHKNHLVCGTTSEITHLGGETHSENITYSLLDMDYIRAYDFPTSGSYFVLEDLVVSASVVLANDATLNICLNGNSIDFADSNIIGNVGSHINICNCKGNVSTVKSNGGMYLFNQGSVNIYGAKVADNKNSNIKINTNTIYNSGENTQYKSYNVKYEGLNVDAINAPTFTAASGTVLIENSDIEGFKTTGLISNVSNTKLSNINIKNNEFNNFVFRLNNGTMNILNNTDVLIERNTVKTNSELVSIVKTEGASSDSIILEGNLIIKNNKFKLGTVGSDNTLTGIYMDTHAKITVRGKENVKLEVSGNKIDDTLPSSTHVYDIYSMRSDGYIDIESSAKFDTDNSKFNTFINSSTATGVIFTNWLKDNVKSITGYQRVVELDKYYDNVSGYSYYMKRDETNNRVEIERIAEHAHFVCGDTLCSHTDLIHGTRVSYKPIVADYLAEFKTIPTKGNYYLIDNVTSESVFKDIEVEGDYNLCLNGKNLDLGKYKFIGSNRTINITNCMNTTSEVKTDAEYIFNSGKFNIYGRNGNRIKVSVPNIFKNEASGNRLYAYNVDFTGNSSSNRKDIISCTAGETVVFENVSIKNFSGLNLYKGNAASRINVYRTVEISSNTLYSKVIDMGGSYIDIDRNATFRVNSNTVIS
ncbi:MAG: hypothetical protein IKP66_09750, partial [Lachnospiraceae bacterium]|nr:hypothetical protein [Lachnospiraceae bacterium]